MYVVAGGECRISIMDQNRNTSNRNGMRLRAGDIFGEIALIYGCKRTASIHSTKYSTLAKLMPCEYRMLHYEFDQLEPVLKKQI